MPERNHHAPAHRGKASSAGLDTGCVLKVRLAMCVYLPAPTVLSMISSCSLGASQGRHQAPGLSSAWDTQIWCTHKVHAVAVGKWLRKLELGLKKKSHSNVNLSKTTRQ